MTITRSWAMANHNTLSIKPIRALFDKHKFGVTVDPFARDCELCEFTNDLNKETKAKSNKYALEFLKELAEMNFVVYDPPYSLRQVKECYDSFGTGFNFKDSQNAIRWTDERDVIASKQNEGDKVLSLGWSTTCMGKKRGYEIEEILIVSHGAAHNDTLCTVERKLQGGEQCLIVTHTVGRIQNSAAIVTRMVYEKKVNVWRLFRTNGGNS